MIYLPLPYKRCSECGIELPYKAFSARASRCKVCKAAYNRAYRAKHPEKVREAHRQWRTANRETLLEKKRAYYRANKEHALHKVKEWREAHREERRIRDRQYAEQHREERRAKNKQYREANREHLLEQGREYYRTNRERLLEYQRNLRAADPEKQRREKREYYAKHPELMKDRARKYRQVHPQEDKVHKQRRRARRDQLPNSWTVQDWNRCLDYWQSRCAYCGNPPGLLIEMRLSADHWIPLADPRPDNPGTVPGNMLPACRSCNSHKRDKQPEKWLVSRFGKRKARAILAKIEAYFKWIAEYDTEHD